MYPFHTLTLSLPLRINICCKSCTDYLIFPGKKVHAGFLHVWLIVVTPSFVTSRLVIGFLLDLICLLEICICSLKQCISGHLFISRHIHHSETEFCSYLFQIFIVKLYLYSKKVKLSRYMPWRHMGGRGGIAPTRT
jgi:hypothetical protein